MLGIIYLHHKFPPGGDGLNAVLFPLFAVAFILGSLVSLRILWTQWADLKVRERCLFAFCFLFL